LTGSGPADALVQSLDDALPQTQCTRCGFPDCHSYAQAIARGEAGINQCPPGGAEGVARLARITGRPALALNPEHGHEGPRRLAVIDEAWCIGCTLCLKACPVDSIVGASKQMHTVIDDLCTGCELCIPVCPVDCISLEDASGGLTGWAAWSRPQAEEARERFEFHRFRLLRADAENSGRLAARVPVPVAPAGAGTASEATTGNGGKRAVIEAALARARARSNPGGVDPKA
jgi:electron transport complex protein RnfB